VRYIKLFKSYCTNFYDCELWLLDNRSIDDLCVAWRKGLQKIWEYFASNTLWPIIPLLCNCLPLFDEIFRCFLNFARACLFHDTHIIRSVALHGILYARGSSLLGRNVSFCMHRYNFSVSDVFSGAFATSIQAFVRNSRDASLYIATYRWSFSWSA
jgi:hypothetical protein